MQLQRRSVLTGLAVASMCPICLGRGASAEEGHGPHWTYEGEGGPAQWGDLKPEFKSCSIGTQQSPIDLAKPVKSKLSPLAVSWKKFPLTVLNNGHTIQVNAPAGSTISEDKGEVFNLKQFHFHHPSEHLVDGKSFTMEVHFVHMNEAGNAALVLGVFIVEGAENKELGKILANMPKTAGETKTDLTINPSAFLPEEMDRYRYEGSLTTPPCSEIIHWNVLRAKVTASAAQIKAFADLFPNNARPVNPLNRRFLLGTF